MTENSARHQLPVREGRITSCTEFIFMLIFNMSGAKRHSVNLADLINPGSRITPPGVPPLVEVTRTTLCTSLRQGCVSGLGALITSFSRIQGAEHPQRVRENDLRAFHKRHQICG